jgi:hypothetical protein
MAIKTLKHLENYLSTGKCNQYLKADLESRFFKKNINHNPNIEHNHEGLQVNLSIAKPRIAKIPLGAIPYPWVISGSFSFDGGDTQAYIYPHHILFQYF